MNTNDFALTILFGIKKFLAWIGIPSHMLDKMDELLFLIVIVIIAFIVAGIVHAVLVHLAKKILKRKRVGFFESMFKYGVFRKLTAIIPPLMVSALLPFAFSKDSAWFILSEKITWIYFFIALIISVNAILNTVGDELKKNKQLKNRPMKGFIQIFRVVFYCVVVIVIISILINKSPLNLITGLGAFTAVLMLVFKDTILGLVAGVMISEDDMLRIGDWIEMPQNNINGTVIDISLDVVKREGSELRQHDRNRPTLFAGFGFVHQLAGHERLGRTAHHARIYPETRLHQTVHAGISGENESLRQRTGAIHNRKAEAGSRWKSRQYGQSRRTGERNYRHESRSVPGLHGDVSAAPSFRQQRTAADGADTAAGSQRPSGPDLLFLLEQKLAELRIHPGRNHGTLRFRIAGVRTLSVPKRRRPRYDPEQLHRIRQSRSIDTDRNPLAYDRHAKQPVRCRKTGGARLISESITDSGFHPLPTRQYRDKRTSGTGIGSPRLQQPDGPAPDRLGPNEKHPAGIGRVFLVTRRATSGKNRIFTPPFSTRFSVYMVMAKICPP